MMARQQQQQPKPRPTSSVEVLARVPCPACAGRGTAGPTYWCGVCDTVIDDADASRADSAGDDLPCGHAAENLNRDNCCIECDGRGCSERWTSLAELAQLMATASGPRRET